MLETSSILVVVEKYEEMLARGEEVPPKPKLMILPLAPDDWQPTQLFQFEIKTFHKSVCELWLKSKSLSHFMSQILHRKPLENKVIFNFLGSIYSTLGKTKKNVVFTPYFIDFPKNVPSPRICVSLRLAVIHAHQYKRST